jgi:coenzyme F420-reducing hydrogenase delta subunit
MAGCLSENCHYESGMEWAKELFAQAKKMLNLLGIDPKRLALEEVPVGRGDVLARLLSSFEKRIRRVGSNQPLSKERAASPA